MINTVVVNNKEIRYAKMGRGSKNFVMLPGVFLTSVVDSYLAVESAYHMFLDEYTIYLFDYKFVEKGFSINTFSEYFIEIFDKLNLNNLYLFGVSMGGTIAQTIALRRPELIHSMILASTFARSNKYFNEVISSWINMANHKQIRDLNYDFYHRCFTDEYLDKYKDILDNLYNNGTEKDCIEFVDAVKAMLDFDVYERLKEIKIFTLVIGVKNDLVLGKDITDELINGIGCLGYVYDNYSHAVYDEADDYKKRIYDFFKI